MPSLAVTIPQGIPFLPVHAHYHSVDIGGKYKAIQNADGTWNLHMVPVLAAHERDLGWDVEGKPVKFAVDDAWLSKALARATERKTKDSYVAPLHVNHHGRKEDVTRAGYFMPRRVGMIHYQGDEIPCMFADFLSVRPEVYAKIKAGDLPYVSVEILDITAEPEIDSCALMDHVVPYFKFPLLGVGEEVKASVSAVTEAGPLTAYARAGKRASLLCYMAGSEWKPMGSNAGDDNDGDTEGTDKKPDPGEKGEKGSPGEESGGEAETKIGGIMEKIMAQLSAIMNFLGLNKGGGIPDPTPVEQKPVDAGAALQASKPVVNVTAGTATTTTAASNLVVMPPVVAATVYSKEQMDAAVAAAVAPIKAELDALKGVSAKKSAEETLRGKVADTMKRLAAYALGKDAEAELLGIAQKAGDSADQVLAAYASAIEKRGIKDPAPTMAADLTVSTEALPDEVLSYNAPDQVKKATEYWNSYKAMGRHAGRTTLKEFLANCMAADATFAKAKSK